jgi:membrane protein DedA with SNARE-associated domain
LNNIGVPMPGKAILFGVGFILGKTEGSLWQPMVAGVAACFLGGICAFWLGRRLSHGGLEMIHWLHLTPEKLKWPESF